MHRKDTRKKNKMSLKLKQDIFLTIKIYNN